MFEKISEILRTTTMKQIRGSYANTEGGACALGVLALASGKWRLGKPDSDEGNITRIDGKEYFNGEMSQQILRDVGLNINTYYISKKIMNMNDTGKTFGDIADFIDSIDPDK